MTADALVAFEPRKTPVQARSAVTVDAISEATIQVLLLHGIERLTTTRVAQRAGVSVGTLYQYFPNKQSMLFAVLERHLHRVAERVEAACDEACHKPLAEMIKQTVEAFVDAKMERADVSVALYRISADVGGPTLIKPVTRRMQRAVEAMFRTAPDLQFPPDKVCLEMMFAAMGGVMRSLLESEPSPAAVRKSRDQLVLLCQAYMAAATAKAAA